MKIIEKGPIPKYYQLKTIIAQKIKDREYPSSSQIPSEDQLMQQYHLSYSTVSRALKELEQEGLLYCVQGKGTFVSDTDSADKSPKEEKKSNNIGLLIFHEKNFISTDPFFTTIMSAIKDEAKNSNITLFATSKSKISDTKRFSREQNSIDGLIIISPTVDIGYLLQIQKKKIPYVVVGRYPQLPNLHSVDIDTSFGTRLALKHLINSGHRRIGFIHGLLDHTVTQYSLQTYQNILKEENLTFDKRLVKEGKFTLNGGYRKTLELLNLSKIPTAIFAANSSMVLGVMKAAREKGVKVPDEIAVVGYDDFPFTSYLSPPLTTIAQPIEELGKIAVRTLFKLISGKTNQPIQILLKPRLVTRESCGAKMGGDRR
ncbi:MAG: GntR family transcriptional regulator [Candidatus Omnitrophica bacterium]|nr:GntR family transcriptional regulator [Candidatus Omnitrophota bacterium]